MGDVFVPYVSSTRYLGVLIDSKLSWRAHLKDKINDCKKTLMMCRNMVSKKWGLTPARSLWIWNAIVKPKLTYACVVWG